MKPRSVRMHRYWAVFFGAYYICLSFAEALNGMDLSVLAPLNLSLAAVIAGVATQLAFRVRA